MRLIDADKLLENLAILAKYKKGEVGEKSNVILGVAETVKCTKAVDAICPNCGADMRKEFEE